MDEFERLFQRVARLDEEYDRPSDEAVEVLARELWGIELEDITISVTKGLIESIVRDIRAITKKGESAFEFGGELAYRMRAILSSMLIVGVMHGQALATQEEVSSAAD